MQILFMKFIINILLIKKINLTKQQILLKQLKFDGISYINDKGYSYFSKYFVIKKQNSGNGDYLVINLKDTFQNKNYYTLDYIENKREKQIKIGIIITVVAVSLVIVIAIIVIIFCCVKIKTQQRAMISQKSEY